MASPPKYKKNIRTSYNFLKDPEIRKHIRDLAIKYNISPEHAESVFFAESTGNPNARNAKSSAVGPGQITNVAARQLGYRSSAEVAKLPLKKQIELSFKLWGQYSGKIKSKDDLYLANFYPKALGKSNNFVLGDSEEARRQIARANKGMDVNKDNRVTKGEVGQWFSPFKNYKADPFYVNPIMPSESDATRMAFPMQKTTLAPVQNVSSPFSFVNPSHAEEKNGNPIGFEGLMQLAMDPSMTRDTKKVASVFGIPMAEDGLKNTKTLPTVTVSGISSRTKVYNDYLNKQKIYEKASEDYNDSLAFHNATERYMDLRENNFTTAQSSEEYKKRAKEIKDSPEAVLFEQIQSSLFNKKGWVTRFDKSSKYYSEESGYTQRQLPDGIISRNRVKFKEPVVIPIPPTKPIFTNESINHLTSKEVSIPITEQSINPRPVPNGFTTDLAGYGGMKVFHEQKTGKPLWIIDAKGNRQVYGDGIPRFKPKGANGIVNKKYKKIKKTII